MKQFYIAVSDLYQEVQRSLPVHEGNPCGSCRSCCTAAIGSHKVGELELATMAFYLGEETVGEFRRYLDRETGSDGQLVYAQCPNLGDQGCTVHEHRPLSCRLHGHFRSQSAELFEHCVFRGTETVVSDEDEYLLAPGQQRLSELRADYQTYFPASASEVVVDLDRAPRTPMEHASRLVLLGNYAEAVEALLPLASDGSLAARVMLATSLERLGLYDEAISVLDAAIALSPENPELYTQKGGNCLWAGHLPQAVAALSRSVELAADRRNAWGMLGLALQLTGELEAACDALIRAVELEEEPGPFRFQLALVLKSLGEVEAARAMLHRACEFSPGRGQAERALAEF